MLAFFLSLWLRIRRLWIFTVSDCIFLHIVSRQKVSNKSHFVYCFNYLMNYVEKIYPTLLNINNMLLEILCLYFYIVIRSIVCSVVPLCLVVWSSSLNGGDFLWKRITEEESCLFWLSFPWFVREWRAEVCRRRRRKQTAQRSSKRADWR